MSQPSILDTKIELGDISEYWNTDNLLFIFVAALVVDAIVMALVRHLPDFFGGPVNTWYDMFGLSAVIGDVGILVIGVVLAQLVYSTWIGPTQGFLPGYFTMVAVIIQILHDIAFYFGVIKQVPRGKNDMIDVFKDYSKAGWKVILADSAMIAGTCGLAMVLKELPGHITTSLGLVTVYSIPYLLYVRNKFTQ
jgi:hypothetical protein